MVTIKTKKEIEILREGGKILAEVLVEISKLAKPGISTGFLNDEAEKMILVRGAFPAFKGYTPSFSGEPYPTAICASLNEVVVHGVPSQKTILKNGDVLKIDIGVKYQGLFTDSAVTVAIGEVSSEVLKLMETTRESLESAIRVIKAGVCLGDIGNAIGGKITRENFSVIEDLVGHGVGYDVHEEPNIPNYGKLGEGMVLKSGMVLAIEPMATLGRGTVRQSGDSFGYETKDGSISAHFEHTVVVTDNGCEVLTIL
jgi:methionyl aminopeptidase